MPKKIDGKTLTPEEDRQWKHVFDSTHDGAQATAAVQKSRKTKKK